MSFFAMPGLVPGLPMRRALCAQDRDCRDEPGDDGGKARAGVERSCMESPKIFSYCPLTSLWAYAYYPISRSFEGRLRRRSQRRSGMRRPRAGLVSRHPGGRGHPSAPTTRGCLRWLDAVGLKAGGSPPDKRRQRRRPPPGSTGPRTKTAAVERREAPSPDRKGEGDASQASRAAAPAAQGVSQTPAFPGAPLPSNGSRGRGPCPGRHNNRGHAAWPENR